MLVYIFAYLEHNAAKRAFKHWNNQNKQQSRYAAWSFDRVLMEHDVAVYDILGGR